MQPLQEEGQESAERPEGAEAKDGNVPQAKRRRGFKHCSGAENELNPECGDVEIIGGFDKWWGTRPDWRGLKRDSEQGC